MNCASRIEPSDSLCSIDFYVTIVIVGLIVTTEGQILQAPIANKRADKTISSDAMVTFIVY